MNLNSFCAASTMKAYSALGHMALILVNRVSWEHSSKPPVLNLSSCLRGPLLSLPAPHKGASERYWGKLSRICKRRKGFSQPAGSPWVWGTWAWSSQCRKEWEN